MIVVTRRSRLFGSSILACAAIGAAASSGSAAAQEAPPGGQNAGQASQEVVVTGSRIRRAADDTAAPVTIINQQDLTDRGYITAGQALNDITANAPSFPVSSNSGVPIGSGQTYPNLFNLGAGRTLTLVDGLRFASSTYGGDRIVDTNIIPTGLIDRIDVVEAGGAAVYGSDAIAGVVNYVLKKNFQGEEVDIQTGISTYGDQPQNSAHATFGRNFDDGRGNIAFDAEWSKTDPMLYSDRPYTAQAYIASGAIPIRNATFWEFNNNGVIFAPAASPVASYIKGQFSPDGSSVLPFNTGVTKGVPFAIGGDGTSYGDLTSLQTGEERYSATAIGHYDFSSHLKISGSLFYGHTTGEDPYDSKYYSNIFNSAASGSGPISFTMSNPYLTAGDIASISAAYPAFATGGNAYLSKIWSDLTPSRAETFNTDYYRGVIGLNGDFNALQRNFYYSVSLSHMETTGDDQAWGVYTARFNNAINAAKNSAGQIVCAENAVSVVDASCVPINPFGSTNVSAAARAYVSVPVGETFNNTQNDFLANIGGDIVALPAGAAKFSLGYEHRSESATYSPDTANQLGLAGTQAVTVATHGSYETNEYSSELLIPILAPGFNLPLARTVELSGQYRLVDNSIAGQENVWGLGLRWEIFKGLTFRASRSRNFRAPTLTQLLAPQSVALGAVGADPCDNRYISAGSSPSTRLANCQALFAAHPGWGALASFQDPAVNYSDANITTGGNDALQNEISNTTTLGLVFHPDWVPGNLNLQIDRVQIDLKDGLTALTPAQFLAACYDSPNAGNSACNTFARDPTTGYVTAAESTTYNAASVIYHGETLNADYRFPLSWVTRRDGSGSVELEVQTTHNDVLRTNVVGAITQIAGTYAEPRWNTRFDIRYAIGPLRVTYQAHYLPSALYAQGATAANTPVPVVASNLTQDISMTYNWKQYQFRAGINNIANQSPSFPTLTYGDIIGREFFVGLKARY